MQKIRVPEIRAGACFSFTKRCVMRGAFVKENNNDNKNNNNNTYEEILVGKKT
jgi:hypothetical protein